MADPTGAGDDGSDAACVAEMDAAAEAIRRISNDGGGRSSPRRGGRDVAADGDVRAVQDVAETERDGVQEVPRGGDARLGGVRSEKRGRRGPQTVENSIHSRPQRSGCRSEEHVAHVRDRWRCPRGRQTRRPSRVSENIRKRPEDQKLFSRHPARIFREGFHTRARGDDRARGSRRRRVSDRRSGVASFALAAENPPVERVRGQRSDVASRRAHLLRLRVPSARVLDLRDLTSDLDPR